MVIIPYVRKRIFLSISTVILGLLALFVFQTTNSYLTQKDVLEKIEERRLKINLSIKIDRLSDKLLSQGIDSSKIRVEMQRMTEQLVPLMHTSEGKSKVQNLQAALKNAQIGGKVEQIVLASKDLSEFQLGRLGDDLGLLEGEIISRGFSSLINSIALTIILGIGVIWGLHRLAREYLLTKVIMQGTNNGIIVGNAKGRVTALNDVFCQLQGGCKRKDMVGVPLAEVGEPGRVLAKDIQEHTFMTGQEVVFQNANNQDICLLIDTIPWKSEKGNIIGGMAVVRDYTDKWLERQKVHAENEELREKAERDSMTSLYNYRAFIEHMKQLILCKQYHFSLLMIDLDYFKVFNDTLGHLAGDRLLIELAQLMVKEVRDDDMVARYGGDEFVIVLQGANLNRAVDVGERLRLGIANHIFQGQECLPGGCVTISMGISVYPENGSTVEDLIRCADTALYQAKRHSRNRLEYYQEDCGTTKEPIGAL